MLLPLLATEVLPSSLTQVRLAEAMPYILAQGIGVGLISSLTYAIAIARLGVAKCAAIGALAPAIAAVLAVPLLHEALSMGTILAVLIICAGVMLASRPKRETDA